jgi:uncharacterized protein (DUF58 family)
VVAEICALLAFAAARNNDRVGLLLFTDRIEKYVPPRKGRRHVLRVLREVLYYEPAGKRTNLALALETVRRLQRKRAVVFVLSDFLADGFERPLRLASRFHDLVALVVRDPREASLPAIGLVGLEDAETGECVIVDTSQAGLRERFRQAAEARAARLQGLFQKLAIDAVELWTDRAYDAPLVRFFARRARRALAGRGGRPALLCAARSRRRRTPRPESICASTRPGVTVGDPITATITVIVPAGFRSPSG